MDASGSQSYWQVLARFGCTSASCCIADGLPMDMLKVRMQLQNTGASASASRLGIVAMSAKILKTEGVGACFAGVGAAMMRQASYGGLCFGMYPFVRDMLNPNKRTAAPFYVQLTAGALAGGGSAAVANPFDVVKVRLQGDGRRVLEGKPRQWPVSAVQTMVLIYRTEGLRAMYTAGLAPNVLRASVVNGCGIAVYDSSKGFAEKLIGGIDLSDRARALSERFVAALAGGIATSLVGCPFDVVKTRLMAQSADKPLYRGPIHCIAHTLRHEGALALWKGLLPVYGRQAPFNLLNYLIMEQLMDTFVR